MRSSCVTSAKSGRFSSVSVSRVSIEAIISGRAAFLAPEIGMTPFNSWPPTILILSMYCSPLRRVGRIARARRLLASLEIGAQRLGPRFRLALRGRLRAGFLAFFVHHRGDFVGGGFVSIMG